MKIKKILFAGIAGGLGNILIGSLLAYLTNWILTKYFNVPEANFGMSFPLVFLLPVTSFVIALIWVFVFALLHNGIPGFKWIKGFIFGLLLWLVSSIPQNILQYLASNDISTIANIVSDLIQYPLVCLIFGIVYEVTDGNK